MGLGLREDTEGRGDGGTGERGTVFALEVTEVGVIIEVCIYSV
jgi:hypothetical protein